MTPVTALDVAPDGRLFAAEPVNVAPDLLWAIEPTTGASSLIGEIGLANGRPMDLAFDETGRLFLLASSFPDRSFLELDPTDGSAIDSLAIPEEIWGLGAHDGALYTTFQDAQSGDWWLAALDGSSGELTPQAILPGFLETPEFVQHPDALAFDDDGSLWVSVTTAFVLIDPPAFTASIYHFADPFSGDDPIVSETGIGYTEALAVQGPVPTLIEVPTLAPGGALLLALGLAALGALGLRPHLRRSNAAIPRAPER